ncbi:MAG: DUF2059 domain-containing protein [Pseudomonadota bacterium]
MKSILIGAAVAVAMLASSAQAQQPDEANATRLSLSRQILAANGGAQAMESQLRSLFTTMATLTKDAMPSQNPKAVQASQAMMTYIVEEEIKALPQLIDQTAMIYAKNLTETELRDMLAWSLSPSAQAIRAKMPAMMRDVMLQQQPLLKRIMAGAVTTAVERACTEAKCSEDERRTIIALAQKNLPQQ